MLNPGATPGSGPAKSSKSGSSAHASAVSMSEFKTAMSSAVIAISELMAVTIERTADKSSESNAENGWGRGNCDNPALAHQDAGKKSKNN